ncbi:DNA translocase FtsK [Neobacillus sp. WH10]|uniref:DNA translocase FtsK n=1 Tax=Neobacillus sp. WH10 TaxID=3047873 RepID=UPI0024C1E825|nr:DNA translocase FtsK [Neobacillus sp. WH10]WHY76489.1 DNA translocase FtsK [Neobacillus sp. WH10]
MSWIQNFFQKFKKDEEEYNDYIIHNHNPDSLLPNSQNESLKDLDTRISYQYPKGGKHPSRPPKTLKKEMQESLPQKRPERPSEKRRKTEKPEVPPVKKEIPKKMKEFSPRVRGPFHPTEIPSPVFGFNRPKKTDAIVEHELSHFLDDDFNNQLDQLDVAEEVLIETGHTKPFTATKTIPETEFETPVAATEIILETELETTVTETKTIPETEFETLIMATETIAGTELVTPVAEIEILSETDLLPQVEKEVDVFVNNPVSEQEEVVMEVSTSPLMKEIFPAKETSLGEIKNDIEHTEVMEATVPEPEPSAPKRSRLPFNVMMLKQDKQKWEEKNRKMELEKQPAQSAQKKLTDTIYPVNEPTANREEIQEDGLYVLPKTNLLNPPVTEIRDQDWLQEQEELLNQTLQNFNVGASVVNVTQGPSVTRFEVQPEPGVKVNKITNLSDDIKLSLAARDIRIEAPIPGKHTIGIEVPNQKSRPVLINEIIQSDVFHESASPLTAVLGLDIAGNPIVTDLKKMPHGLIAGATGSGKSVCINSILVSLLYKARPEDLKLLLIDPKMVELAPYNRIPHLVAPVITDVKAATAALKWAVDEMERRYELFAHTGVRDINRFNELAMQHKRYSDQLPFIVIIIDELADLMMMSPADVEEAICRIAQKARACGIHLIVATQRPSVDVITGLIKANIPTRIAFSVSSQVDSRTIIDISGAEKLLGRGDMLFLENGSSKPVRLQGTFVSDEEIDLVVAHVREQREPEYLFEQEELLKKAQVSDDEDELFYEACEFIVDQGGASTSSLQRRFKIGYNRAARLMDMLEQNGYISSANGSKPRDVLITEADLESIQE